MSKKKKFLYLIIGILLVLSLVLHLLTEGLHHVGFYTITGFLGAWILVLLGKKLLPLFLARPADYYGGDDE